MREDQRSKIEALSERLADVFIAEADPDHWTGSGAIPADLSQQERGNRLWDKKNAMATGGVLRYTLDLIAHHADPSRGLTAGEQAARDADLDRRISDAERRAAAAVERVLSRAKAPASGG